MSESQLTFEMLKKAVGGTACAFRCRIKLQPAAGPGEKVFPPTYEGATYAVEERRLPGQEEPVNCVLLDSIQSQANRMEAALQLALDEGKIELPLIEVDFSEANQKLLKPIDARVTSLTVPHRLADAILRDCVVAEDGPDKGKLFRDSSYAESWRRASPANATPIYELCPTALVFGVWGAPEKPGGLGAKFQRCITSEIVAIDAMPVETRKGLRTDPLGIIRDAEVVVDEDGNWENPSGAKAKTKRPSEINHGPIIFETTNGGITFREAVHTSVLTLAGLRWLRFPLPGQDWKPTEEQKERDVCARTVLAAIGLCAAALAQEAGYDLRSGCLLHPAESPRWEMLDATQPDARPFHVSAEAAIKTLKAAVAAAKEAGFTWRTEPIRLKPSDKLVELIARSQTIVKEKGEGA